MKLSLENNFMQFLQERNELIMNKAERKQKMDEFNESIKEFGEKVKDYSETAAISGMYAKDAIDEKISDAKSGLAAAKENARLISEKGKSKFSSALLKAQMELNVAKENIAEKKEAKDKEKLSKYIDDELEYAESSLQLAFLAAQEAKLAFLEAVAAQKEYDEKYGEDE